MGASGWTAPPGEWFVDVLSPEGEGYVAVLQVRHAPGYTGDVILLDYIRVEKNEACDDGLDWMPAMYRLAEAVRKCERIAGDE